MSLAQLEKLIAHLPERERREVLKYARQRNTQAIILAAVLLVFWLLLSLALFRP